MRFFDINLAPKAKVLRIFAQYATEESEKMSLIKLAETSIKDSPDFYTLLRVLEMHPSVNVRILFNIVTQNKIKVPLVKKKFFVFIKASIRQLREFTPIFAHLFELLFQHFFL